MCATTKTCCSKRWDRRRRSSSRRRERIEGMEKGMENGEEKMGGAPPVDAGVRARRRESASWGFLLPILLLVAPPASVTLAQPTPAAAQHAKQQRHAPQGYGKATFGITLDQARALYPALTKA